MRAADRRSACPVAMTLDLVGDKWTLLIIRDMLAGKMRYGEFRESEEGIPTNVLASRLKSLEAEGLIAKNLYSQHPPRWEYELTVKGRELGNIVGDLAVWGMRHLEDVQMPEWIPKSLAAQAFERYTEGGPR